MIGYITNDGLLMIISAVGLMVEGIFAMIFILVWFMENDSPLTFSCRCDND